LWTTGAPGTTSEAVEFPQPGSPPPPPLSDLFFFFLLERKVHTHNRSLVQASG
jgi:hypothetical protein